MTEQVNNLPAVQETQKMWVQLRVGEITLENEMAARFTVLAYQIP